LAIKNQEKNDDALKKDEQIEAPDSTESEKKTEEAAWQKQARQFQVLNEDLESERRKSTELTSRMRYLQADISNLQRQSDRRVAEVRNQVKLAWILEILSIKEDLDRAVSIARDSADKSSLLDGLLLVASRIENILKLETVEVIPAEVGGRFDPNFHEALSFQETENEEQGTILAVISQGYSVDGKVIKPAMVEVARRKEKEKSTRDSISSGKDFGKKQQIEIEEAAGQKNA